MYKMLTIADKVRVPPSKFVLKKNDAIKSSLEDKWEGTIQRNTGVALAVTEILSTGEGRIIPGDGAIYYPVEFRLLVYRPENHEVVRGDIIDVTEFGVFVRIGPIDGMVHVSQLMDDFVSYDQKNSVFVGRESKRMMKEGDTLKARIISVSLSGKDYKIGLTTRQAGLGAINWLEKAKKRDKEKAEAKPERKKQE